MAGENVLESFDLIGIRVHNLSAEEIVSHVDKCIERRDPCHIVGINVDQALRVVQEDKSKEIFDAAEIVFIDGKPIVLMGKMLKHKIKERISGPDLMELLCARAIQKGHSIFLLGAAEGVAANASKTLQGRYPNLKVAGTYSPPYGFEKNPEEVDRIVEMLKKSNADQLFVGMGSPKQDIFIYENMKRYGIPVSFSMGAAIDFIGGNIKRAPRWMQNAGLEWFHRFLQEPTRLFRRYFIEDMKIFSVYWNYHFKNKK